MDNPPVYMILIVLVYLILFSIKDLCRILLKMRNLKAVCSTAEKGTVLQKFPKNVVDNLMEWPYIWFYSK